ncbi:uncharacterized protein [Physcomitrium patens]|uniref:Small-subunit processome Utp12 domain-containing protein n=1 Tax=Physcomitrium patens TaxID=3218 RepID=A0A2K1K9N1_PHYPA|nr:WD repeat-containing protein 43-like [Physcomitrium patens]PNR50488.1 hypothetical protein PHYPA_009674 [Physcomitrium patens]|eukprot:XP_024381323.1 WD repeat-containing protein 43-like [Physcomitrella patens]
MSPSLFSAFHPHGSALALSAGDGRIKIWDSITGNLRNELADLPSLPASTVASGHLALDYTCMAWGALPSNSSTKKKKKGAKEKGGAAVVVVGTGSGDIISWDTTLGELKWRASDCHAGSVTSVAFSKSGKRLYSVGHDAHVCELDSSSGQVLTKFRAAKTPLSCVAVAEDGGTVAVASAEVKLFDLSSKKRLRKFPGHPTPVKTLCFTPDGKYLLSAATGERHVVLWHVEGGKSETSAPISLSVEHPVATIDISGFDEDGDVLRVIAVSEGGCAYIWSAPTVNELETTKPTIISVGQSGKGRAGAKPRILAARFLQSDATVLVVHGTSVKPHFEKVPLCGQEGSNIVLSATVEGALLPAADVVEQSKSVSVQVTVLGLDNAGEAAIPRPQIDIASAKKKAKKRRAEAEDEEAQPNLKSPEEKTDMKTDLDDVALTVPADEEPTLEERMIALKVIEEVDLKDLKGDTHDLDRTVVPRADSLQVLLSQALQADDNSLLEQCLNIHDEKVISNTIRRLRPFEAAKFLTVAVSKMEGRPQRALGLVPWVRAVLLQHASFVMTNLALQPVLTSLYQIIEARLSVFRPLLSLSGRLDLVMAQIQKNESQSKEDKQNEAAVVYEEEDDDGPEAINVMVDGGSQYEMEDEDDGESESEDEDEDDDMEDDDDMEEDKPDIKLNGNGNGLSDGDDED